MTKRPKTTNRGASDELRALLKNQDYGASDERAAILRKVRAMQRSWSNHIILSVLEDWIRARDTRYKARKGGL